MSLPPDHPDLQNPRASSESKFSASTRPRQPAWGLSNQPGSRRGLANLNTSFTSASNASAESRNRSILTSPPVGTGQAFAWGPSASTLNNRSGSARHTSSASSSTSNFASLIGIGAQQQLGGSSQLLSSPRSRTTTPFSTQSASSAAAGPTAASSGGGGGSGIGSGGGQQPSRAGNFSPVGSSTHGLSSPTNAGFDRAGFGASTPSGSGGSSLAKITVTQVFLLLGSITDKEGKGKWESQAESIRKLVADHGMDVFARYFRRLVTGNAPTIFPESRGSRSVENPANYPMLVEEVKKVAKDPEQANRIAEAIDTTDDSLFRDFDLSTFINHFKLNGIQRHLLAYAFTRCSKADLRHKASSFLTSNFEQFLSDLENPTNSDNDTTAPVIATAVLQVFQLSGFQGPDATRKKHVIGTALSARYKEHDPDYPDEIRSVFALIQLFEDGMELAVELIREGHGITDTWTSAEEALRRYNRTEINDEQVAGLLLAIVFAPDAHLWRLGNLTQAIENVFGSKINWQKVVSNFDRESVSVTQQQFLALYNCLVPFAREDPEFDIQLLWGGKWNFPATQLSFAIGLTSLLPAQLDAQTIPRLRKAYDVDQCLEGLEGHEDQAEQAKHDTMISLDAVAAIMSVVWSASESIPPYVVTNARSVIQQKITLFLCSCVAIPQPWARSQEQFIDKFMGNCLFRVQDDHSFILHCFWKQNRNWTAQKLYEFHASDPMKLPLILEHAQEHGWLTELCTTTTGFGIDLAALAHRRGLIDLQEWIDDKTSRGITDMGTSISKFLDIKAQDEVRTAQGEQLGSRTVILAMKTVYQMLQLLDDPPLKIPTVPLKALQRLCVRAYPRLINYGGDWDELIERSGTNSNQLPPSADAQMQDYYRRMYNQELQVREVIEVLSQNKGSAEPSEQDLFACMIHGLFDEYLCFHEYPLQPLATTAVLFGGIISYRLVSGVALSVAKEMVLEAVREFPTESSMFKFGLQALLHILNRLPEWPEYCQELVQIPGLQGTEVYNHAQNALKESRASEQNGDANGTEHEPPHLSNGELQSPGDSLVRQFMSISVEVPADADLYQEPDEDTQGKVMFVLNNVTDDNLQTKMTDLLNVLERQHHHWFAEYLVEQRAKSQQNYQPLYLRILEIINNKGLWSDVLRETYVSVRRVMNAESTMKNAADRTHLKNLGTWLGSLTLARDKPIRHKNIAFKELLIEGFETQRLLLVIPFTCEVLQQGARSKVMKPPNPWVNDIIGVLMELYDMETTKIQQKFAIEFMLNTFGLPRQGEGLPRSDEIRKRQLYLEAEPAPQGPLGDGLADFGELAIGPRASQRSPAALSVPDLSNMLVYPSTGSPAQQERVRAIVSHAVHQAIHDIVQPVVERSVTIASIATKDLVQKDFSLEADENKIRSAYLNMVRPLASSLAHVTCKDPLKQCITNYMRAAASEAPEDLPEGTILMTINDNLEVACEHVRQNAEERSLSEVDAVMDEEMQKRREHNARYPNEPYRDPAYSEWSKYLPEPYKIGIQGLNDQQLDIYRNFGPQARGLINHTQQGSTDSGRQIPDVLQDALMPSMPNISTPAEQSVLPLQPSTVQSRATPAISEAHALDQVPAADYETTKNAMLDSVAHLEDLIAQTPEKRWRDLTDDDPVYIECMTIIHTVHTPVISESLARDIGPVMIAAAYEAPKSTFDIEVKVHLSYNVCSTSDRLMFEMQSRLQKVVAELEPAKVDFVAVLLESGWIDYSILDKRLAELINSGSQVSIEYLSKLLDLLLFSNDPVALRADFALSIGLMGRLAAEGHADLFKSALDKLTRPSSLPTPTSPGAEFAIEQGQMQYMLDEWLALVAQPNVNETAQMVFLQNLHDNSVVDSMEKLTLFVRTALTTAVNSEMSDGFQIGDALAKMVILLVRTQGTRNGSRPEFTKNILMVFVLLMHHHHMTYKERFSARVFCRFFSSAIYEWHAQNELFNADENKAILIAFAETFLLLDPQQFPGFVFAWLDLISHRIFMPLLLKNLGNNEGGEIFAKLMVRLLKFACPSLQPERFTAPVRELYRGIIKLMLILHHDFAEFLAQNHVRLCNVIPAENNQLRNLVLSAFPSSYTEIPDPMTIGLRVDRLDENKKAPALGQDGMARLTKETAQSLIDAILRNDANSAAKISELADKMNSFGPNVDRTAAETCLAFSHFVVLYLADTSIKASKQSGSNSAFDEHSLQAHVFAELAKNLRSDTRYYLLSAMANQLRFPNSHTHYFNYAILHIWAEEQKRAESSRSASDEDDEELENKHGDVREQLSRIFLERLMVHKPHPWGLLLAMMELFKNAQHGFWDQPYIKATPEAKRVFMTLYDIFDNGQRLVG